MVSCNQPLLIAFFFSFFYVSPLNCAYIKVDLLTPNHQTQESIAVMGPEATSEYFNISGSIQSTNTSLFLNIGSDSTSYKTLTLGTTATMSAWALEGDTIITAQTSSYGRRECPPVSPSPPPPCFIPSFLFFF